MRKRKLGIVLLSYKGLEHLENGSQLDVPSKELVPSAFAQALEDRRAPEGKDDDSLAGNEVLDGSKENMYTTDVNGKVTVHVVVTINGNGTLADLKKQRMQIRNSSSDVNSLSSPVNSIAENDGGLVPSGAVDIVRFTGETDEVVGYSKSKGCCVIQ